MGAALDELYARVRATVGQERKVTSPEEMGRAAFRMYATAVQDFNPVYTDRPRARELGLKDVMAPPTLICDTFQVYGTDIDEEGHPIGFSDSTLPMPLRAANEYEFFQPVMPDDVVTARTRVADAWKREGRSGGLVFQQNEITYVNQRGEVLARNMELMFYRVPSDEGGEG